MKKLLILVLLGVTTKSMAIKPSREYLRTPEIFGIKYSEYKVKTPDNFDINVWDYSVPDNLVPDKTVILVGTDAGNMSYMIWEAKALRERGVRVIAFDYRGFGKSSDFAMNKDYLFYSEFATDLDAVIKNARAKYPKEKIGLLALSMGTYISLLREEPIDFLVAEGFYQDPQAVTERLKARNSVTILPAQAARIEILKPAVPILLFCATDDKITITEDAKYFSKKNNVTIIELKGDHLSCFHQLSQESPGDKYVDAIIEFLKKSKL